MATRKAGLVPRIGPWTGVYTATDLVSRAVTLALNRRGARLSGEISIVVNPTTGDTFTAKFTGTHAGGKITLTVEVPATKGRKSGTLKIAGRLVPTATGGQSIVATTTPGRADQGAAVYRIPLDGAMVVQAGTGEETVAFAADDGGAWVDPGTGN